MASGLLSFAGTGLKMGAEVTSEAVPIPNSSIARIAGLIGPECPVIEHAFIARPPDARPQPADYLYGKFFFVGRRLPHLGRLAVQPDIIDDLPPHVDIVDYVDQVTRFNRTQTFAEFRAAQLGVAFDARYLDGSKTAPEDLLPHPDHLETFMPPVGSVAMTICSLALDEPETDAATTRLHLGGYPWKGTSQYDHDYGKYASDIAAMQTEPAKPDTTHVGNARTFLHSGPEYTGPRVVVRTFTAEVPFMPENCYN